MPPPDPVKAQQFAVDVVRQLRMNGFEALWAGGCVRDRLMGREPKDFDVATNARPDEIRNVFGTRRTLAIGASFGVITVLGPRDAGQIEVATFRRDESYSDGRRPDRVTFCDAEEDARRRDFTVNGLFYDPLEGRVDDYVGGQQDLKDCLIRAIGNPEERFTEDKLRILRAVRFATTLGFDIESETYRAIRSFVPQLKVVSAERISEELRRMLVHPNRARGLELLRDTGLLHAILPEATGVLPTDLPTNEAQGNAWDRTIRIFERLGTPPFGVVLAALFREIYWHSNQSESVVLDICRRWRLSNEARLTAVFCLKHEMVVRHASRHYWPELQAVLIDSHAPELLEYAEAVAEVLDGHRQEIEFCRERLAWPIEKLDPPPLLTGDMLKREGIPAGPVYKRLLDALREAQLLNQVTTREEAIEFIRQRWAGESQRS